MSLSYRRWGELSSCGKNEASAKLEYGFGRIIYASGYIGYTISRIIETSIVSTSKGLGAVTVCSLDGVHWVKTVFGFGFSF